MPILNVITDQMGVQGVKPRIIFIKTNDTVSDILTTGYLNNIVYKNRVQFFESDMALVSTKTSPSANDEQVGWFEVSNVGRDWSLVVPESPGHIVLPTIANHIAVYTDTQGTLSEDPEAGAIIDSSLTVTDDIVSTTGDLKTLSISINSDGTIDGITELDIDNININGNTISSTNTNGNIILSPNGTGITTSSNPIVSGNLRLDTNTISSTNTNGDIVLDPNGTGIVSVPTPSDPSSAATKQYVDDFLVVQGYFIGTRAATTTNLSATYDNGIGGIGATLTATANGAAIVDGITLSVNDLVLFKDQSSQLQNGVYYLSINGTGGTPSIYTRSPVFDSPEEIKLATTIGVLSGTVNFKSLWQQASVVVTIGTDSITFQQQSLNVPASVIDNTVVRFDGATGRILQSSGATLDDSVNLTGLNNIGLSGVFTSTNATDSNSITTGSLVTPGGVGITKNLYVGGLIQIDNIRISNNVISSTDTNGNISLTPNGTGAVIVPEPTVSTSAVTKNYVDGFVASDSYFIGVVVATTINLSATYNNGTGGVGATLIATAVGTLSIDGVAPSVGDFVLIKDQSTTSHNGVYSVTLAGSGAEQWILTRSTFFDSTASIRKSSTVGVLNGTVNFRSLWQQTASVTTVGTSAILFHLSSITVPASSIDNHVIRFDGTTGRVIQSSDITIDDSGNLSTSGTITTTNTTQSTSAATGSIITPGGVGIAKNLYVSGKIVVNNLELENNTISTTNPSGNLILSPNAGAEVRIGSLAFSSDTISSTDIDGYIRLVPNGDGIVTVPTPMAGESATTKDYVDNLLGGVTVFFRSFIASTGNIAGTYDNNLSGVGATITTTSLAAPVLDGVTLVLDDIVLIHLQSNAWENGIYIVTQLGNGSVPTIYTRSSLYDSPQKIVYGAGVSIISGTIYGSTIWIQSSLVTAVGLDNINYERAVISTPSTSTDTAITRFSGTNGKTIKNSPVLISDAGYVTGVTRLAVDNLDFDLNTITATNTNGDVVLTPNGTGQVATGKPIFNANTTDSLSPLTGSIYTEGGIAASKHIFGDMRFNCVPWKYLAKKTGTIPNTAASLTVDLDVNYDTYFVYLKLQGKLNFGSTHAYLRVLPNADTFTADYEDYYADSASGLSSQSVPGITVASFRDDALIRVNSFIGFYIERNEATSDLAVISLGNGSITWNGSSPKIHHGGTWSNGASDITSLEFKIYDTFSGATPYTTSDVVTLSLEVYGANIHTDCPWT